MSEQRNNMCPLIERQIWLRGAKKQMHHPQSFEKPPQVATHKPYPSATVFTDSCAFASQSGTSTVNVVGNNPKKRGEKPRTFYVVMERISWLTIAKIRVHLQENYVHTADTSV